MSLTKFQNDVLRFHTAMELHVGSVLAPGFESHKEADLRASLINEETGETVNGIRTRDPLETIDGLCDALYVTLGCGVSIGFDIAAAIPTLPTEPIPGEPVRIFWRAEDYERLLLAGARVVCHAIENRDSYATGVALMGYTALILHTAVGWGIPLDIFWKEVQRANMDKVGGPIRADGKRLKPLGWRGPDHGPALLRLGLIEPPMVGPYAQGEAA